MKRIVAGFVLLIAMGAAASPYFRRIVTLFGPDVVDFSRLPSRPVPNHPATAIGFESAPSQARIDSAFLENNHTTAFLVIADGKLVDERYFHGHRRDSLFKAFSISKSVLSALFGIAARDGLISPEHPVGRYFDGFHPQLKLDTALDCLSGFRYRRGFWPWFEQPRMYYSVDIRGYLRTAAFDRVPGARFDAEDLSPLVVGAALEAALKRKDPQATIAGFAASRLWQPMGAQYPALWNIDRDGDGLEKVESGLVARAIDLARFGQLYLDEGRDIVPKEWIKASVSAPPKGSKNLFQEGFHRKFWWGSFRPARTQADFYANGHFGQRIYVSPDKRLVIVRMGSDSGNVNWTGELGRIADAW